MTLWEFFLLIGVGGVAGFLNTIAGGGSLITLPVLILLGDFSSSEANASNRIALFFQSIFAVQGFRSKGVWVFPYVIWTALSAMGGAAIGAMMASKISDLLFNRILAVVMIIVIILTIFKPKYKHQALENFSNNRKFVSIILFFGVGLYGGFIQAGIGFLMIIILTHIHGLNMAKTNSIKVFTILCYTTVSLIVFITAGQVQWQYGLSLAIGTASGGWIASRWSVNKNDRLIRMILVVTILSLAIKLWFF